MPLENASYLADLVPTNPQGSDGLGTADDHLRLLKLVLQTTFPKLNAAVTATPAELNTTTGMDGRVSSLETHALKDNVDNTATSSLTITGTGKFLDAPSVKQGGYALVPAGSVIMWTGAATAIPGGWALCDGTNGTPNLTDRFLVGAGASYVVGQTGGATSITATSASAGAHSHGGAVSSDGAHTHSGTTDAQGSHSHGGNTAGTALTIDQIPSHNHAIKLNANGGGPAGTGEITSISGADTTDGATRYTGGGQAHAHGISLDGNHAHNVTVSGGGHSHSISGDGAHTHTTTFDNRPLYYALCFIMKL